jgi:hypothetical protein
MRTHLINTIAHANDPAPVTDMGGGATGNQYTAHTQSHSDTSNHPRHGRDTVSVIPLIRSWLDTTIIRGAALNDVWF